MQKTLIAVVSIMVAGMFLIYSISASYNRFALLLAANGQTYEIDKRSGEVCRITSYNVCYTKLLRLAARSRAKRLCEALME